MIDRELDAVFAGRPTVDALTAQQVVEICSLVVDETLADELLSAILDRCAPEWEDGSAVPAGQLPMRVGSWRLDVGKAAVRSGLITSIVAGSLVQQGMTQMLIGVVAAVVPSVLDVERVELSPADRALLVELRLHPDVRDGELTESELYDRLPEATRQTVNRLDFADFVAHLRNAGYARGDSTIEVRDPAGPPSHFSWR